MLEQTDENECIYMEYLLKNQRQSKTKLDAESTESIKKPDSFNCRALYLLDVFSFKRKCGAVQCAAAVHDLVVRDLDNIHAVLIKALSSTVCACAHHDLAGLQLQAVAGEPVIIRMYIDHLDSKLIQALDKEVRKLCDIYKSFVHINH